MSDFVKGLYNSIANGDLTAINILVSDYKINEKHVDDKTILEYVCSKNKYKENSSGPNEEKDKQTEKIIKALIKKGANASDCPEYKPSIWSKLIWRGGKRKTRRHKSRKSRKSRRR